MDQVDGKPQEFVSDKSLLRVARARHAGQIAHERLQRIEAEVARLVFESKQTAQEMASAKHEFQEAIGLMYFEHQLISGQDVVDLETGLITRRVQQGEASRVEEVQGVEEGASSEASVASA